MYCLLVSVRARTNSLCRELSFPCVLFFSAWIESWATFPGGAERPRRAGLFPAWFASRSDPGVRDFSRLGLCPPYSINAGSQAPDPDHPNDVLETTAVRIDSARDDECGPLAHERNPGNRPSIEAILGHCIKKRSHPPA